MKRTSVDGNPSCDPATRFERTSRGGPDRWPARRRRSGVIPRPPVRPYGRSFRYSPAMCGTTTTLSRRAQRAVRRGRLRDRSHRGRRRSAPGSVRARARVRRSATPRAVLISSASSFIKASRSALSMWCVSGVGGACSETMSARRSSSSSSTFCTPSTAASSAEMKGS